MTHHTTTWRTGMSVRSMARTAIFTALLAVMSQIAIPLPMVPINLGLLAVYLAALLLTRREALWSVCLFLMLGAIGVPVFAGFRGGPEALVGKTGGYLLGYVLTAGVVASLAPRAASAWQRAAACALGLLCCLVPGTLWFMLLTGLSLPVSLGYTVWPFLPGDAIKIAIAAMAAPQLKSALRRVGG